jgi:hypothetical protein
MELSAEEQSFFEAGEAIDEAPSRPGDRSHRRHRSRRRHSVSTRLRRKFHGRSWGKASLSVLLMIAAVAIGYWASMSVATRELPDPSEFGVESRGR